MSMRLLQSARKAGGASSRCSLAGCAAAESPGGHKGLVYLLDLLQAHFTNHQFLLVGGLRLSDAGLFADTGLFVHDVISFIGAHAQSCTPCRLVFVVNANGEKGPKRMTRAGVEASLSERCARLIRLTRRLTIRTMYGRS